MVRTTFFYWRQSARIIGLIVALFFVYLSLNSGLSDALQGRGGKSIQFFPFAAIALAGYMISYIKERQGGILMTVGGVSLLAFYIISSGGTDWLKAVTYSIPIIFCGITFIFCNARE